MCGGEKRARMSMLGKEESGHHAGGWEINEEKLAGEGGDQQLSDIHTAPYHSFRRTGS